MPERSLATDLGVAHLVWVDDAGGDLLYRRSTNSGASWAPAVRLSPASDTVSVVSAAVATEGSTVAVVYRTRSTGDVNTLYLRRSMDKGLHWMPRQVLTSYTADVYVGAPSVAVYGSRIHVVWTDLRDGRVFHRRSVDGGSTFLPRVALAVTTRVSKDARPSVATSIAHVYVAWSPADSAACEGAASSLVMRRSVDGGASFRPVQTIDSRPQYDTPALAASGKSATADAFYATYTLCDPQQVVVARSVNGGATLARTTIATETAALTPWAGDVYADGWAVSLVYGSVSTATGSYRLLLRLSSDIGATWSPPMTAATRVGIRAPQVTGYSTVVVAYQVASGTSSIGVYTRRGTLQ